MTTRWERLDRWCDWASPALAAAAAVAVLWGGITYGSRAATGADAFGYVSQAYLWLKGDLQLEQPLSREFPWPHPEESLTPLGYRPGEMRHTMVPTYSPGLPLIMAASDRLIGHCGPYDVSPVFGALLVAGTYVLAFRLTRSRVTGTGAAVLMAGSPAFLFNLMFPMSDIVTASLWTWTLALLTWPRVSAAAAAACAGALAVVVRPNLLPLALVGAAAAALWVDDKAPISRRARRVIAFSAGIVPAALFVAAVNNTLFGSPLVSGYGRTSSMYALSHLGTNVMQFTAWLAQSESVAVVFAVLPFVSKRIRPGWLTLRTGLPLVVFAGIVLVSYLFYLPFDQWWYLRFLLPVFPVMFLFLAVSSVEVARAIRVPVPTLGVLAFVALLGAYRGNFAADRDVLGLGYGEQRYVAVGQYIDRELPPNAVLLAMQHSGSIRYYSGRLTIRYDAFSAGRFPSVIEWLQKRGYRPYIVLEDWEEEQYRARFGNETPLARLEMRVHAEMTEPVRIRVYDPLPSHAVNPPPDPISIRSSRTCVGPGGVWAE